jgi:hypothetical protein
MKICKKKCKSGRRMWCSASASLGKGLKGRKEVK